MNCKRIVIAVSALSLLGTAAMAQESKPQLKWYGFIRNYAAVDTRESVAGTEDFFYYLPKDEKSLMVKISTPEHRPDSPPLHPDSVLT